MGEGLGGVAFSLTRTPSNLAVFVGSVRFVGFGGDCVNLLNDLFWRDTDSNTQPDHCHNHVGGFFCNVCLVSPAASSRKTASAGPG